MNVTRDILVQLGVPVLILITWYVGIFRVKDTKKEIEL